MSTLCVRFNFRRFSNLAGPDVSNFSAHVTTSPPAGKLIG